MRFELEAALASLAVALLGGVLATLMLQRRGRRRSPRPSVPAEPVAAAPLPQPVPAAPVQLACPGCNREYPAGLRFCPHDARPLVRLEDLPRSSGVLFCPACRRSFEGRARFCPFDAEELLPGLPTHIVAARAAARPPRTSGKICPSCGQHYDADFTHCRRDGAELVTVN